MYLDKSELDAKDIEAIESAAEGCSPVAVVEDKKGLEEAMRRQLRKLHAQAKHAQTEQQPKEEEQPFKFVLVLEFGERSLSAALTHDRIAGVDLFTGRKIAADLARALDHLHSKKRIHADLKPLNSVRRTSTWQLIDMDVSCALGTPFGTKQPASGYCPPEMAKLLLAATNYKTGKVETAKLATYNASIAYDLWSFGVVLFHLITGMPLWKTDQNDNLAYADLQLLARHWNVDTLNSKYHRAVRNPTADQGMAIDLITKLLEPTPEHRLAHFSPEFEMMSVLYHPFFFQPKSKSLDDTILTTLQSICTRLDKQQDLLKEINGKVDQVLDKLNSHFTMLSTLLKDVASVAPKLICFLPVDAIQETNQERWWRMAFSPRDWLNQRILIFFVDPIRLTLAHTNGGKGFEMVFPKAWVVKVLPYVKLGLAVLKIAAIAGRLSGLPVPNIAGVAGTWIDEQLGALEALKGESFDCLLEQTKDKALARKQLDKLDAMATELASSALERVVPVPGGPLDAMINAPLEKSFKELDKILPDGWKEQSGKLTQ